MFEKSAQEWTLDDLKQVVTAQRAEDVTFELKQELPLADGASGWRTRGKLNNSERDGLAKEIVALANTYGGTIIIGVEETADKPKRAASLYTPLPNLHDLVDRLRSALHACIDPPIQSLQLAAVLADGATDEGYVVVTVPPSIAKPHGVGCPPAVYTRRDDRSDPATMRDQQNMFWEARTDRERISAEIESRTTLFNNFTRQSDVSFQFVAVSAHAMSMYGLARAVRNGTIPNVNSSYIGEGYAFAAEIPTNPRAWRPTANGVEARYSTGTNYFNPGYSWEIDETGVISLTASNSLTPGKYSEKKELFPGWYAKSAGSVLGLCRSLSQWSGYRGNWLLSGRFLGLSELCVTEGGRGHTSTTIDLSDAVVLRPISLDISLPDNDLDEIDDRIWQCFGRIRPDDCQGVKQGVRPFNVRAPGT